MDLKNTINNTNTHKENIKQVATQIDNKLVELGGEQATDLSDVANKMGAMVTGNYKKVAILDIDKTEYGDEYWKETEIPINLDFTPSIVIISIQPTNGNTRYAPHSMVNIYNNSMENQIPSVGSVVNGYIKSVNNKSIIVHWGVSNRNWSAIFKRVIAIE